MGSSSRETVTLNSPLTDVYDLSISIQSITMSRSDSSPRRSDILIDKNSLSNNEFHELGDDFLQNNFVMRPKSMINLSMVSYL